MDIYNHSQLVTTFCVDSFFEMIERVGAVEANSIPLDRRWSKSIESRALPSRHECLEIRDDRKRAILGQKGACLSLIVEFSTSARERNAATVDCRHAQVIEGGAWQAWDWGVGVDDLHKRHLRNSDPRKDSVDNGGEEDTEPTRATCSHTLLDGQRRWNSPAKWQRCHTRPTSYVKSRAVCFFSIRRSEFSWPVSRPTSSSTAIGDEAMHFCERAIGACQAQRAAQVRRLAAGPPKPFRARRPHRTRAPCAARRRHADGFRRHARLGQGEATSPCRLR